MVSTKNGESRIGLGIIAASVDVYMLSSHILDTNSHERERYTPYVATCK